MLPLGKKNVILRAKNKKTPTPECKLLGTLLLAAPLFLSVFGLRVRLHREAIILRS